jgi:hypothetical protein
MIQYDFLGHGSESGLGSTNRWAVMRPKPGGGGAGQTELPSDLPKCWFIQTHSTTTRTTKQVPGKVRTQTPQQMEYLHEQGKVTRAAMS